MSSVIISLRQSQLRIFAIGTTSGTLQFQSTNNDDQYKNTNPKTLHTLISVSGKGEWGGTTIVTLCQNEWRCPLTTPLLPFVNSSSSDCLGSRRSLEIIYRRGTVRVQCCFTSTETVRTIRDGEPRTATSTFTQLLSSVKTVSVFHFA